MFTPQPLLLLTVSTHRGMTRLSWSECPITYRWSTTHRSIPIHYHCQSVLDRLQVKSHSCLILINQSINQSINQYAFISLWSKNWQIVSLVPHMHWSKKITEKLKLNTWKIIITANITELKTTKQTATSSFGFSIKANHFTIQDTWRNMWTEAVRDIWCVVANILASTIHVGVVVTTEKCNNDIFQFI